MKKIIFIAASGITALFLAYCNPSKKTTSTIEAPVEKPKFTYASNVSTVITSFCSPCHIPSKGGNKKAYDNYENTKQDIDEIIRRVELNPDERGFMPFKHAKLNDSTIAVFKQWKADGMLEK
jgi:hypothetical protein